MTRFLSHSLVAAVGITLVGFLIHFNSRSSIAHANLQSNEPVHPLAVIADSLRDVTMKLDRKVAEVRSQEVKLRSRLALPVASKQLLTIAEDVVETRKAEFVAVRPDAFQLSNRIEQQIGYLQSAGAKILKNRVVAEHLPTLTPTVGTRSSKYGVRIHPITHEEKMHKGLDIAAETGTPIHVTGNGVVVKSGVATGYGNVVVVDHGYGYRTLYAHASKLLVKEGDTVNRGDIVALVGTTGGSTGPHLHYEVIVDGERVDPSSFLKEPLQMPRRSEPKRLFSDLARK